MRQEKGKVCVLVVGSWSDRAAASLGHPGGEPKYFGKARGGHTPMPGAPLASYFPFSLAPVSLWNLVQPQAREVPGWGTQLTLPSTELARLPASGTHHSACPPVCTAARKAPTLDMASPELVLSAPPLKPTV